MAEIFATKEAYKYAENLILQYLRDSGYDGSMEDGTGLYDVVVKPNALLYSLFRQDIDKVYAYMSLAKAQELRYALSEADYDAAIDGIMSNWFMTRSQGMPSSGLVRMWYSQQPEFVSFAAGEALGSYEDKLLLVRDTVSFTGGDENIKSDFGVVANSPQNATEYYVDVPVVAADSGEIYISSGSIIDVPSSHIYFVRATAAMDFMPGIDVESSDAFVARTKEVITTRELITDRAIHTVLRNEFPEITRLYVAGHGVPEMMRDVKTFAGVTVHVGNMADLWVASYLVKSVETVPIDADGRIQLETTPLHIMSIVLNEDEDTQVPLTYTNAANPAALTYSMSVEPTDWLIPNKKPEVRVTLSETEPVVEPKPVIIGTASAADTSLANQENLQYFFVDANSNRVTEISTRYGTYKINSATGTYNLEANAEQKDVLYALRAYDIADTASYIQDTLTIAIKNALGEVVNKIVSITIRGNNDAPVLTVNEEVLRISKDVISTSPTQLGTSTATDVDTGEQATLQFFFEVDGELVAEIITDHSTYRIDPDTGTYTVEARAEQKEVLNRLKSYNLIDNASFVTDTLTIAVKDVQGAVTTKDIDITITGPSVVPVLYVDNTESPAVPDIEPDYTGTIVIPILPPAPKTVTVTGVTSHVPELVHNFVYSQENRVASYDPQVKMMVPVIMKFILRIEAISKSEYTENEIKRAVVSYVNGAARSGAVWIESEMVQYIHNAVYGVTKVHLPVTCTASFYDMGRNTLISDMPVNNTFALPENTSEQITTNTIQYYTDSDLITVIFG